MREPSCAAGDEMKHIQVRDGQVVAAPNELTIYSIKPSVSFNVEQARRLGFAVPDWKNPMTPIVEMLADGRRLKRSKPQKYSGAALRALRATKR